MTNYGSDDVAFFLVDGYSILGQIVKFSDKKEAILEVSHTLGDSWEEQTPVGVKRMELRQEGFFDDATGAVNEALSGNQGSARVVSYGVEGNTVGKAFVGGRGPFAASYERVVERDRLHKANAQYTVNGAIDEGVILHALGARTADGNSDAASHDNAASSASGGRLYVQVSALTLDGHTAFLVTLRHSADNISFADKQAAAAVGSAPSGQSVAVSGTINRYTSVSWDFTGSGTSPTATFMAGVARA